MMLSGFSRIYIKVPDLGAAKLEYAALLGDFDANNQAALHNITVALLADPLQSVATIAGLTLIDANADANDTPLAVLDSRGLQLQLVAAPRPAPAPLAGTCGIKAVDHIVLNTNDADACIRLFGPQGLGMRLALDQLVPEWGGRMLFFRCGKLTLEVIHNLQKPVKADHFWGITYQCENLQQTLLQLDANGVAHSSIRPGRKPGTQVATVKSHNLGIPTLLIQPAVQAKP